MLSVSLPLYSVVAADPNPGYPICLPDRGHSRKIVPVGAIKVENNP